MHSYSLLLSVRDGATVLLPVFVVGFSGGLVRWFVGLWVLGERAHAACILVRCRVGL